MERIQMLRTALDALGFLVSMRDINDSDCPFFTPDVSVVLMSCFTKVSASLYGLVHDSYPGNLKSE